MIDLTNIKIGNGPCCLCGAMLSKHTWRPTPEDGLGEWSPGTIICPSKDKTSDADAKTT